MSKHHFTSRTKARKRAADVVFEADQRGMGRNPDVLRDLLAQRRELTAALTPLPEYSVRLVEGVADNLRRIDDLVSAHARVAGLDRMAAVDLAVLRVATWEMLANTDEVPPLVAIDEAVAIVKSISTDASPAFVNAVLDAIRKDLASPAWSRERVGGHDDADAPVGVAPAEEPAEEPVEDSAADDSPAEDEGVVAVAPAPEDAPAPDATAGSAAPEDAPAPDVGDEGGRADTPQGPREGHPTLEDLTKADLETLDELLDEY